MADDENRDAILRRRARFIATTIAGLIAPACAPAAPAEPPAAVSTGSTSKPAPRRPPSGDRDDDRVPDAIDKCPSAAEDIDKLGDDDGCPETDFDLDGVPDREDHCPSVPVEAGRPGRSGCPAPCLMILPPGEIVILERVQFGPTATKVSPEAGVVLDEIVKLIKGHPEFNIEVQGHSDPTEPTAVGLKRAKAVRDALLAKGVAEDRLLPAKGFGKELPLESNDTPAGRAKNRRVEFKIITAD